MDNFRRINFSTKDDIQGTPFYRWIDLAGKKITKLYIPMIPSTYGYWGDGKRVYSNNGLQDSYDANGNKIIRKKGTNTISISGISTAFSFSATSNPSTYERFEFIFGASVNNNIQFQDFSGQFKLIVNTPTTWGATTASTGGFNINVNSQSQNPSLQFTTECINYYYGCQFDDIPYQCFDFQNITVNGTQIAYQQFGDQSVFLSADKNYDQPILSQTLSEQYPFYYEEYQE